MSRKKKGGVYQFFITLPDRLYPFSAEIKGKRVRGRMSYQKAIARAARRYGPGHYGITLLTYRQFFHFIGSILFIIFATIVSKLLFGSNVAVYVLLVAAILAITFQEFYLHPRIYQQRLLKGVADWLAWVAPISIYLFTHFH